MDSAKALCFWRIFVIVLQRQTNKNSNTMKKQVLLSVLLALGMTCGAQAPWDGTVAEAYAGGDGTPENPYQIATAEQLALLAQETNETAGGNTNCYVLTADLCMNGSKGMLWTPIGTVYASFANPVNPHVEPANPFKGIFEGNNHIISDLYADNKDALGLFGCTVRAVVQNLQIVESSMTQGGYGGIVVGMAVNTSISNCVVDGIVEAYGNRVGGIVGSFSAEGIGNDTVFIRNCTNNALVTAGAFDLGGIAGHTEMENGNVLISHCVNNGEIGDMWNTSTAGGMVGRGSYIIRHCHNYGRVSGEITAGGLVGQGGSFGLIEYCINHPSGEVTGGSNAGGIIGTPIFTTIRMSGNMASVKGQGTDMILVGGIAGSDGSISNCYNTGDLTASLSDAHPSVAQIGGITGSPTEGFVYNVYNTGRINKIEHPNLTNEHYGHIIPAILSDTAIRNCYYYGNEDIPTYVYNASGPSYVYLPGSCAFNEGTNATTWTLDTAQYGTTDLLEALNAGAMGECTWIEDTEGINRGFPVIGEMDLTHVKEQPAANRYSVYPNPADNVLFVQTVCTPSLHANTYRITNLMGQVLQSGQIVSDVQQIDVSALPSGMYFLTIDGETAKIVVR